MKSVKIQSLKNQRWIADQCSVARSFFSRLKGLIGKTELSSGEGLLLCPCNDIHMWFMSMPIDVIFIRKKEGTEDLRVYQVTSVRTHLKPWRIFPVRDGRASDTIELPVGTIQRCDIQPGDEVCIS
jgi:uncharacterized membrane protein (UPF0127 family)